VFAALSPICGVVGRFSRILTFCAQPVNPWPEIMKRESGCG
jgi:hypothetical protein